MQIAQRFRWQFATLACRFSWLTSADHRLIVALSLLALLLSLPHCFHSEG
jgi:hypothetical protein